MLFIQWVNLKLALRFHALAVYRDDIVPVNMSLPAAYFEVCASHVV